MPLEYVKPESISLKNHPEFNEAWLRDRIVEDTTILGLGDLEVKDVERIQPKAGRLDLLLRDIETSKRYEVELMLGAVDESHIIRTIEYWDIERKRYPQFDHCAVIVAEDITSRFLNVISLFNSAIPIIAIQLNALKVGESIILSFTTVLDEVVLGIDDEDEDSTQITTDRNFWENKGTKNTVEIADECVEILKEIVPSIEPNYVKNYIGLKENGRVNNFFLCRAKKKYLLAEVKIADHETWKKRLEEADIELVQSTRLLRLIRFRITKPEVKQHHDLLKEFFEAAYKEQQG